MLRTRIIFIMTLLFCYFTYQTTSSEENEVSQSNDFHHSVRVEVAYNSYFPILHEPYSYLITKKLIIYYDEYYYVVDIETAINRYQGPPNANINNTLKRSYKERHIMKPKSIKKFYSNLKENYLSENIAYNSGSFGLIGDNISFIVVITTPQKKAQIGGELTPPDGLENSNLTQSEKDKIRDNYTKLTQLNQQIQGLLAEHSIEINRDPTDEVYNWDE